MSDGAPAEEPAKTSIWASYRGAATWIKVVIPVAILVILVGAVSSSRTP